MSNPIVQGFLDESTGIVYDYNYPNLANKPTIPAIDSTLTQTGEAADAKAVGDALSALDTTQESIYDNAIATDTASGAIANFPDGADGLPVKKLEVEIEPVQSGSGDPSPDNVRPISGFTGAKVTRAGKNLFYGDVNGYMSNADGSISSGGGGVIKAMSAYVPVGNNTRLYYFIEAHSSTQYNYAYRISYYDTNKNWLTNNVLTIYGTTTALTIPNGTKYIRASSWETEAKLAVSFDSIEEYPPYQGQTYTIDLNGTRYGGTLDVTTGVLTVDRANVDIGTLEWNYNGARFQSVILGIIQKDSRLKGICSSYPVVNSTVANAPDKSFVFGTTSQDIYIKDSSYTDKTTFTTAMNGVQVVYELATPQTYQLTAQELTTLLGTNNIFADTGDVSVTYRCDTTLFVNKKIAEAIANALI